MHPRPRNCGHAAFTLRLHSALPSHAAVSGASIFQWKLEYRGRRRLYLAYAELFCCTAKCQALPACERDSTRSPRVRHHVHAGASEHREYGRRGLLCVPGGLPRVQPCDNTALQAQLPRSVHRAVAAPAGHVRHLPSLQAHCVWAALTQLFGQPEMKGVDADTRLKPGSLICQCTPVVELSCCSTTTHFLPFGHCLLHDHQRRC